MPPTYRERLRLEGAWLTTCGAAGSAILLATTDEARRWPLNTVGQLVVAGGLTLVLGRRGVKKALAKAESRDGSALGTGEPTPLWMHPLIVAGLAAVFPLLREAGAPGAGWDASLRITGGAALVGLVQALVLERTVADAERENGRTYYRAKGSQGSRTVLESVPARR